MWLTKQKHCGKITKLSGKQLRHNLNNLKTIQKTFRKNKKVLDIEKEL